MDYILSAQPAAKGCTGDQAAIISPDALKPQHCTSLNSSSACLDLGSLACMLEPDWHAGLQMQTTDLSDGSTVENRLLRAAHDAGMVLPSNAANLQRLRWSRSSRTDKGVHAQSTVSAHMGMHRCRHACLAV